MDIFSLVIILAILVFVIVIITRPFYRSGGDDTTVGSTSETGEEQTEYNEILARIRELDFEYKLGKIAIEDYMIARDELKMQAAGMLQSSQAQNLKKEE